MRRTGMSIRLRLTLVATAASLLTLTMGTMVLYRSVSSSLDSALTDELRVHAHDVRDDIQRGVRPPLNSGTETQVLSPEGATVQPSGEEALLDPTELQVANQREVILDEETSGSALRVLAVPAVTPNGTGEVVVVAGTTASISRTQQRLMTGLAVGGIAIVAGTTLAAWWLSGAALKPVRSMSRRARTLSTDDPDGRLPVAPGRDEIAELGVTLNEMIERIADARTRERSFIDDASHELRAPLAVLRGELELALLEHPRAAEPDGTERALTSAIEETDRLALLTDHLLLLARADAGMLDDQRDRVSLRELATKCAGRIAGPLPVEVGGPDVEVFGSAIAIEQVITNLLVNAQRWGRSSVLCETASGEDEARLRVADDGPGFTEDYLKHPFDRFRRGDPARGRSGSGGGLGLAIVAAIVAAHGGKIHAGNDSELGGAWVEVTLRMTSPAAH